MLLHNLIGKIKSIKKTYPASTFKVINITGAPENKNIQITYQVSGKVTTVTESPTELISSLMQLSGFTKDDSKLIYDISIAEKLSPFFKIISIFFVDNPIKFEIEDIHSKYTFLLAAKEIINSEDLLRNFSSNDIKIIFFQFMKENEKYESIAKNFLAYNQIKECEPNGNIYIMKSPGLK